MCANVRMCTVRNILKILIFINILNIVLQIHFWTQFHFSHVKRRWPCAQMCACALLEIFWNFCFQNYFSFCWSELRFWSTERQEWLQLSSCSPFRIERGGQMQVFCSWSLLEIFWKLWFFINIPISVIQTFSEHRFSFQILKRK
jgi:hypothetical protein